VLSLKYSLYCASSSFVTRCPSICHHGMEEDVNVIDLYHGMEMKRVHIKMNNIEEELFRRCTNITLGNGKKAKNFGRTIG
jgi:hypothetical protein